jgi:hypothetical protein
VLPSPVGTIRHWTRAKTEVLQLCNLLPKSQQVTFSDVVLQECVATGSFGKVWKAQYHGAVVAAKRYRADHFRIKSEVDMFCHEVFGFFGL